MQLRLNQGDMGVVSLKEKLLDDMEGIRIAGSGALHILAAGEVKIAGSEVRVAGTGGVLLYEGTAEADQEGNIVVAPQGKIELSAEDGERAIHNRGKEVTYYLAWEHEDLSHPSNRYRDAPQQKDYDWMKLGTHVAAGLYGRRRYRSTGGRRSAFAWGCGSNCRKNRDDSFSDRKPVCGGAGVIGRQKRACE